MTIHPGDLLAGYRIVRLLGRGGMGEVWAASPPNGGAEVALKVLQTRAAARPELVARFEREARACAAIANEHVCRLLGHALDPNGTRLLVFEKLEGETLGDRLKRETYLPFAEVAPIVEDILVGLAAAHAAGVIHRDLKPGNVFLERAARPDGFERAKILDFGVSKVAHEHDPQRPDQSLTDFDATLGSFAYMAPEQVRGSARVDPRCDLYAVGTMAFRALAARLPFAGPSTGTILALKLDRTAPSLGEVTGDRWPVALERFLARALERDPLQRFASAVEALGAWRACAPASTARRSAMTAPPKASGDADAGATHTSHDWEGAPTETEALDA